MTRTIRFLRALRWVWRLTPQQRDHMVDHHRVMRVTHEADE